MAIQNSKVRGEIRPRVLVVDDDEKNRMLLTVKLEREGYEVANASNGLEAIEKVKTFSPDIVIMDVMMPQMDGYEALRILKSAEETKLIPVIMLTGRVEVEDKIFGFEVGAEDYISKPYSLQEVSARVRSFLRMRFLQTKLRETEKVAALGEMVDGIAHEIRNPLTTIGGMARRLYETDMNPQKRSYAEAIMKSVDRLERMLARIDEYKKVLTSTLISGDLNSVIGAAVKDTKSFIESEGKDVALKVNLLADPPPINMDSGNMRVAIFNVLQNSVEAIDKKGEIRIETAIAADNTIILEISDTGSGISKDDLRKVFNPFQTSKFKGAGLGLTITYRIIHDHGGDINIESEPGKGTTVIIKLHPAKPSTKPS